jgi:lipopolysaccharide export system protein LptA
VLGCFLWSGLVLAQAPEGQAPETEEAKSVAKAQGVSLRVEGVPELLIQSEQSTWDMKAGKAVFSGGVLATRGSLTLRCDSLTVEHDESGEVRLALASGRVEIERDDWKATGGRATLDQRQGSLVLTESPQLEEGGNRLVGERIRVFLENERVECEQCTLSLKSP